MAPKTKTELTFFGHASFGIETRSGARLCLDPYEAGGLGGNVRLEPIPGEFDAAWSTHEHPDHCATHTLRFAESRVPGPVPSRIRVAHDEFGGRLRGGFCDALLFNLDGLKLLHLCDLGERLSPDDPRTAHEVEVLIVPVGGYFTVGAYGAARAVEAFRPRVVIPCHASDTGVTVPQLAPRKDFLRYFDDGVVFHEGASVMLEETMDRANALGRTTVLMLEPLCLPGRS